MLKLIVIADDLTGSLDTGIKFTEGGAKTKIIIDGTVNFTVEQETEVLVICLPTRHLSPEDAYQAVYQIVKRFTDEGHPYIYKKIDSVLRGNIGSELEALSAATSGVAIPFVPAFPAMGRTTRDGVQLLKGVPISETLFSADPYNPVTESDIVKIIHQQSNVSVKLMDIQALETEAAQGSIMVLDAQSDADLANIAQRLRESNLLRVTAGCAGFAEELRKVIGFGGVKPAAWDDIPLPTVLVCGSANLVTLRQLEYAQKHGIRKIVLPDTTKAYYGQYMRQGYREVTDQILRSVSNRQSIIIATLGSQADEQNSGVVGSQEESKALMEEMVSTTLQHLLDHAPDISLLIVGGDTLMAFLKKIRCPELRIQSEIEHGIVLSTMDYKGKRYRVISKSGGFGNPEVLFQVMEKQIGHV